MKPSDAPRSPASKPAVEVIVPALPYKMRRDRSLGCVHIGFPGALLLLLGGPLLSTIWGGGSGVGEAWRVLIGLLVLALCFVVPFLLHRVTLHLDRIEKRTWRGSQARTVAYTDIRAMEIVWRWERSGKYASYHIYLALRPSEDEEPLAEIELPQFSEASQRILMRVLRERAPDAKLIGFTERFLNGEALPGKPPEPIFGELRREVRRGRRRDQD